MWLVVFFLVVLPLVAQSRKFDFVHDIQPILVARCASCHGGDKPQAGLTMHTRAELLKGGQSGPAIVPGNSRESLLIQRVTGFKAPVMPFGLEPLSDREIEVLREWIDQGAVLGDSETAGRRDGETAGGRDTETAGRREGNAGRRDGETAGGRSALALRRPVVPAATIRGSGNPIDHFVAEYFSKRSIAAPARVSEGVFARRAYLDLWGLLPTPAQSAEFLRDARTDKRERLIETLLANQKNYSEHWISLWNDLLRNDEGVIYHGARQSITPWLLRALAENLPYDQFVRALLDPRGAEDPAGFLIGVNWRGDVSASQTPPMQAAQNSAQVFLGVNLKCNSCHDSFISRWKLKDAYGLASLFSESEMEIYRCDVATGEKAAPKFLFPELGGVDPGADAAARHAAAARLFTSPENGRFARTVVNRYWKRLFGKGLVEPVDDMEAAPWHAELLDWLASDFADHHYDVKQLLRRILSSETYQLPSVRTPQGSAAYEFRGPLARRLTAEQFADAVSAITGEWRVLRRAKAGAGSYVREWRVKSSPLTRALGRPIRDQVFTERNEDATTLQALELVNGETMATLLHRGARRLTGEFGAPPANLFDSGDVRGEKVTIDIDIAGAKELRLLIEDVDSYDRARVVAGWAQAELVGPNGVTCLAHVPTGSAFQKRELRIRKEDYPNSIAAAVPSELIYDIAGKGYTRFRAVAGLDESSLKSDINPKVRFFVFGEEPDRKQLVRVEGEAPVSFGGVEPDIERLITRIYRHALGRDPGAEERAVAMGFFAPGGAASGRDRGETISEGLEDLLWSIFLSPEFQYIH